MKISTKGRYAVRLMLDLALFNTGEPVALKDIAKRQEISEKYLEQIISTLNKAGFVRSIRGASGGYVLTREPKNYTVGEILRLTEGELTPVDCASNNGAYCDRRDRCVTINIWSRLYDAINNVVDGISLEDLVNWSKDKAGDYSI